jgi:hypothetical protein
MQDFVPGLWVCWGQLAVSQLRDGRFSLQGAVRRLSQKGQKKRTVKKKAFIFSFLGRGRDVGTSREAGLLTFCSAVRGRPACGSYTPLFVSRSRIIREVLWYT